MDNYGSLGFGQPTTQKPQTWEEFQNELKGNREYQRYLEPQKPRMLNGELVGGFSGLEDPNSRVSFRGNVNGYGDTIIGREGGPNRWSESALTLLWLGEETAVFREAIRTDRYPEWRLLSLERADWNLCWHDWRRAEPGEVTA